MQLRVEDRDALPVGGEGVGVTVLPAPDQAPQACPLVGPPAGATTAADADGITVMRSARRPNRLRASNREDLDDCRMWSELLGDPRVDEREVGVGEVFGVSGGEERCASGQRGGGNHRVGHPDRMSELLPVRHNPTVLK